MKNAVLNNYKIVINQQIVNDDEIIKTHKTVDDLLIVNIPLIVNPGTCVHI